jgi:hypothetical protein
MRIRLTFKDGPRTIAVVNGKEIKPEELVVTGVQSALLRAIEAEQLIERLTGLRVHITAEDDEKPKTEN